MEHKHYYYDVGGWEAVASSTENRSLVCSLELLELLLLLLLGLAALGSGLVLDGVEVLDKVGDVVVVVVRAAGWWPLLALLDGLVRLGELAERRERVGAELVEDAGDELGELLHVAGAVDGEGVGGNGRVHCTVPALAWAPRTRKRQ